MIARHGIDLIAIGNGTASRETEKMVADLLAQLPGKKPMKPMAGRGATLSRLPPAGSAYSQGSRGTRQAIDRRETIQPSRS